jgi:hypothetical protein
MMADDWRKNPDLVMNYIADWKDQVRESVALHFGSWPDEQSSLWNPMFDALKKCGRDTAWKVIDLMAAAPPKTVADATTALPGLIARSLDVKSQTGGMTRDEAHAASQGLCRDSKHGDPLPCDTCGGEGLAYYVRSDRLPFEIRTVGGLRREVPHMAFCCPDCPMGRWMASRSKIPDAERYRDHITRRDVALGGDDDATTPTHGNAEAFKTQLARELAPARAGVPF